MYVQDLVETYVNSNFIILGYFNLPKVMWFNNDNEMQIEFHVDTDKDILDCSKFLFDFMKQLGLIQLNIINNVKVNILDLIFTNCIDNILII